MADTKTIIIQGESFEVSAPYAEGHTITAAEAKALNQTRSENIGNNMRKVVKDAIEAGTLDEARTKVAEYDREYEFTLQSTGGSRRVMDPVEREARNIARTLIKQELAKTDRKVKDVDPEVLEAKITEVAANEKVLKMARKRVDESRKLAEIGLEGVEATPQAAA